MGCSPWGRTESDTTEATQQQQQMPEVNLRIEKMTEEQKQNGVFLQKKKKKICSLQTSAFLTVSEEEQF